MNLREIKALKGPTLILASDEEPLLLVSDEEGTIRGQRASSLNIQELAVDKLEPTEANQVLVARSFLPGIVSFKNVFGKYLGCDSLGKVSISKEAVGPGEEWTISSVPGGFALQNYMGKYLAIEHETGRLRADSETVGFEETLQIRHQKYMTPSGRGGSIVEGDELDLTGLEKQEMQKFISWGDRRQKQLNIGMSQRELEQAQQSGQLHEALLERRIKSKHDPFC